MQKSSDLRFVLGVFSTILGLILVIAYLSKGGELGNEIHLNLIAGVPLTVFGGGLLCLCIFSDTADEHVQLP